MIFVTVGIIGNLIGGKTPPAPTTTSRFTFDFTSTTAATTQKETEKETQNSTYKAYTSEYKPSTNATTAAFVPREIPVEGDFQYTVNFLMSRYSETDLRSFDRTPGAEGMSAYGVKYTYLHQKENWEKLEAPVTIEGKTYNYRIKDEFVSRVISKHFGLTLIPNFHENKPDHYGDYYYHMEMGGIDMDDLSVVTRVVQTDDNIFEIYFELYDAVASNRSMYSMNNEQVLAEMSKKPFIRHVGSGKAVIHSYDIYDVDASYLTGYQLY